MRYIHPNWIVVKLADDGVASCYYPACEPLYRRRIGVTHSHVHTIRPGNNQSWGDKLSNVVLRIRCAPQA